MARAYFSRILGRGKSSPPMVPARPISSLWKSARLDWIPQTAPEQEASVAISRSSSKPPPNAIGHKEFVTRPVASSRSSQKPMVEALKAPAGKMGESSARPRKSVRVEKSDLPNRKKHPARLDREQPRLASQPTERSLPRRKSHDAAKRTSPELALFQVQGTPATQPEEPSTTQRSPEIPPVGQPLEKEAAVMLQPAIASEPRRVQAQSPLQEEPKSKEKPVSIGKIEVQVLPPPVVRREPSRPRGRLARGYAFWSGSQGV